jgi:aconitate hydratase
MALSDGLAEICNSLLAAQNTVGNCDELLKTTGIGSVIYAKKPGDGSAREQAASSQKVLGGWANIAVDYATKRYRSNLINWGMLPFTIKAGEPPMVVGDWIFIPSIRTLIEQGREEIPAQVLGADGIKNIQLELKKLNDGERAIILKGCLINYYAG